MFKIGEGGLENYKGNLPNLSDSTHLEA